MMKMPRCNLFEPPKTYVLVFIDLCKNGLVKEARELYYYDLKQQAKEKKADDEEGVAIPEKKEER